MTFNFRNAFRSLAVAAIVAAAGMATPAAAQNVNMMQLAAGEGPLGDFILGNAKAPVTVIEYASMTCPHCAAFHNDVFDGFKAAYIDTGKVRFILREFPLDAWAAAAFSLARCSAATGGADAYYGLIDVMFEQQRVWTASLEAFVAFAGQNAGFTQATFDACINDTAILDHMQAVYDRATALGVNATPTFFINGQKVAGEISLQDLGAIVDGLT